MLPYAPPVLMKRQAINSGTLLAMSKGRPATERCARFCGGASCMLPTLAQKGDADSCIFLDAGLLGAPEATRATYPKQGLLPDPRLGLWRGEIGTYLQTPVLVRPGTPEPDTRTHKLETSIDSKLLCRITGRPPGVACIGLCCDRIVEMILCRSARGLQTAISKRASLGIRSPRTTNQNGSDRLSLMVPPPLHRCGRSYVAWSSVPTRCAIMILPDELQGGAARLASGTIPWMKHAQCLSVPASWWLCTAAGAR
jgi:hypothetical protein